MAKVHHFSFKTVIVAASLVGFVGFGFGFNYSRLATYANDHLFNKGANQQLPSTLDFSAVQAVYDALRQNYASSLNANQLIEGAKQGLVAAAGDPYTVYLDQAAAKALEADLNGTFSGIGAEIAIKNNQLVVQAPVPGTPAEKAGLMAGDAIIAIDGADTTNMSVEDAVAKIRGQAGTKVTLTIVRGNQPAKDYTMTRAVITVPAVNTSLKADHIGYIQLIRFDSQTDSELVKAAKDLKNQGATKFILDLRNNPGGLLDEAVSVSDEFLDVGKTIVQERRGDEVIQTFKSNSGGALLGSPLVVLINGGSASASEIVAGALKDNGVATLVGNKSFGKGSVQQIINLGSGTELKVTIALWYTPSGRNITKEGIEPDAKVSLSAADFNHNRDPQLAKAISILRAR